MRKLKKAAHYTKSGQHAEEETDRTGSETKLNELVSSNEFSNIFIVHVFIFKNV